MTIYRFERVESSGTKAGRCAVCGNRAFRSVTYGQTLNPFNKNAAGELKTRDEIYDELGERLKAWQAEPVKHAKCE